MKKLWILLVALAMLASVPIFASDVTLSGEFQGFGWTDFSTMTGEFKKVELNLAAAIDDYNTLKLEIDSEATLGNADLDDVRLVTDFGAALGLPIGVKTTIGYFDTYFNGSWYYDGYGWAYGSFAYPNQGPDPKGAWQLDVAAGPVNVHWYNDGAGQDFMVGADASFAGASVWLAYGSTFTALGDGNLGIEANYNVMDMANVAVYFSYDLDDTVASAWAYGVNLGADFGMFHAGAGLSGVEGEELDKVVIAATVAPADAAKIAVGAFLDLGDTGEAFSGLDVSAAYNVGAAKFILGYMYVADGAVQAPAYFSGENSKPDGFYLGVDVDY